MDKAYSRLLSYIPGGTFCNNVARIVRPPSVNQPSSSAALAVHSYTPSCFNNNVEVMGNRANRQLGPLGSVPPAFAALFAAYVSHRDGVKVDDSSIRIARPFIKPSELIGEEAGDADFAQLATALFMCRERTIQVLDSDFDHIESDVGVLSGIVTHALGSLVRHDQQFSADQQSS